MQAYKYNVYRMFSTGTFAVFYKVWQGNSPERGIAAWNKAFKSNPNGLVAWELFNIRDRPSIPSTVMIPEEKFQTYKKYNWNLETWSPEDYTNWNPEFHPITRKYLKVSYMNIDDAIEILNTLNIPITMEISGNPKDDKNPHEMWESCRRKMATDDLLDRRMWFSVSGCGTWEALKRAHEKTPVEFLKYACKEHGPNLANIFKDHERMPNRLGFVYTNPPTEIRITLARYGYDVHSIYGEADKEEKKLNRLVSAMYGMPANDFDVKTEGAQTQSETVQMIIREWMGGL